MINDKNERALSELELSALCELAEVLSEICTSLVLQGKLKIVNGEIFDVDEETG